MLKIPSKDFIELINKEYERQIESWSSKTILFKICEDNVLDINNVDFIFDLAIQLTNQYKKTYINKMITKES